MSDRIERDSMGEVSVPAAALYGAQTQRAVNNFGLHRHTMPPAFIGNLAMIKSAAAQANAGCGALPAAFADAISEAAATVMAGGLEDQFPVSLFQTGSGTSSNMNMNEVLARLASDACGEAVHPNDHVNCSQSSNDMIPSCILVTAARDLHEQLLPALRELIAVVGERADELQALTKTGRTHLMDAMPLTFGQELGAWAYQLRECEQRFGDLQPRLRQLPLGGSAVGTGVNVPAGFAAQMARQLQQLSGLDFEVSPNPYARMAGQDVPLECSAALRSLAVVLSKVNNDLRWMASGPLSGLAEIELEALQPGSSIMPGKVNPVLPEAVLMVAAEVIGGDTSVALAAQSGSFQLNVMLPLIAGRLSSGCETLSWACRACAATIAGFRVNEARIAASLASNPILVTALNTTIGYEAAASIAKRSYAEQRPVIDVAVEETGIAREELRQLLDPYQLTRGAERG
ncbi:class II fumarate hydratase [Seongchinamella sediminis]|uniref:fumarate hydratase n=1 Tax=Seongchinamella sediminis TaxID=2283635 RepID=A0A3L7DX94_9GAMM|nr:class II fumarate hydratase [Seongchinamella sediminis]RLQ21776.1 class II fumarate hydratase [Seongchinamella sediminis]